MKHKILHSILILSFSSLTFSSAHAGFFSSLASMATNALVDSVVKTAVEESNREVDKAIQYNSLLWNMHEAQSYSGDFMAKAEWLEKNAVRNGQLDTVAWVYMDNGYTDRALSLYENKILNNCGKSCDKFNRYYATLKQHASTQISNPSTITAEQVEVLHKNNNSTEDIDATRKAFAALHNK